MLDNTVLKDLLGKSWRRSHRRAYRLVSVDPKTVRRELEPDNPQIRVRMREVAGERRRFGYRRIGLMLEREGITMNQRAQSR